MSGDATAVRQSAGVVHLVHVRAGGAARPLDAEEVNGHRVNR